MSFPSKEDEHYLKEQIITYIGNKRKLLPYIEEVIKDIIKETGFYKFYCADLFSGSGIVSRLMKQYSYRIAVNDLEKYSKIINECYLYNKIDFDRDKYNQYRLFLENKTENLIDGVISCNYSPKDDNDIQKGERVFYTKRNARFIDTVRLFIDDIETDYQKFFLAPLLYSASVHVNTSGIFKSFYKDKSTGIGKFGGQAQNCLNRICSDINIIEPVFSNYSCEVDFYQEDANNLVMRLSGIDIAYLDPPYNQHPYGSNYFMLNTIVENKLGKEISKVSGIPNDWNKSAYNKRTKALDSFRDLIDNLDAKYIIISYNSDGFMGKDDIIDMLSQHGDVSIKEIRYNTFRGSRNLCNRDIYVQEYIFVLRKR